MKQVSVRQLMLFVAVISTASRMFMLPVLLMRTSGRDSIVVMTIHVIFEAVILLIILTALHRFPNTDVTAAVFSRFGKVAARIFFCVAFAYFFMRLILITAQTALYFEHGVFEKFNWAVMMPILLLFVTVVAGGNLRALSRTNELVSLLIGVCLVGLVVMTAMSKLDYANVLPLFVGSGTPDGLLRTGSFIGDFTPLIFFVGKTNTISGKQKGATLGLMLGASVITLYFILGISSVFGNMPHLVQFTTNISNMHAYGQQTAAARFDLVFYTVWSLAPVIAIALTAWAATQSLAAVFPKVRHQVLSFSISVALYLTEVLVFNLDEIIFGLLTPYVSITMYALSFALPLIALICLIASRRKSNTVNNGVAKHDEEKISRVGKRTRAKKREEVEL